MATVLPLWRSLQALDMVGNMQLYITVKAKNSKDEEQQGQASLKSVLQSLTEIFN